MVTVKLKGVAKVKAKGRTYYYAWRGGPRLDGEPGTPEFLASYDEARSRTHPLDRHKLSAWVTMYKASDYFAGLADSTKRVWWPWFDRILDRFGELSIRQFDRAQIRVDIRHWRDQWKATPRTADFGKQVLSRVLSFAVSEGALQMNPCDGIPNLYHGNRANIVWRQADIDALLNIASPEVGWVARMAVLTGLRQGDLLKLAWTHIHEFSIELATGKSRGRRTVLVPMTQSLRDLLAEIPKRAATVLTNGDGRPWRSGFSASWNKTMKKARLSERNLHFHDLRGTAATTFYRAGLSVREIADIMGWSEDRVERLIDRYVKKDELLRDRIRRIEETEKGTKNAKLAAKP